MQVSTKQPAFQPTKYEMMLSMRTGYPASFFRVNPGPALLTKDQQAMMRDMVSKRSVAHKLFSKGAEA